MLSPIRLALIRNGFYCFYSVLSICVAAAAVRTTGLNPNSEANRLEYV
jgi:hypothetical protein